MRGIHERGSSSESMEMRDLKVGELDPVLTDILLLGDTFRGDGDTTQHSKVRAAERALNALHSFYILDSKDSMLEPDWL